MRESRGVWGHAPLEKIEIWNIGDAIFRVFRVCVKQSKCEPSKKGGSTEPIEPPPRSTPVQAQPYNRLRDNDFIRPHQPIGLQMQTEMQE